MKLEDIPSHTITPVINRFRETLLERGVRYDYSRTKQKRIITLMRFDDGDDTDDGLRPYSE